MTQDEAAGSLLTGDSDRDLYSPSVKTSEDKDEVEDRL